MNELFYIFYFIALSHGFPTETIFPNATQSNDSTANNRPATSGLSPKRQYPKQRIMNSVYRPSAGFMNPMSSIENLLLYLLLAAGKDFAEEEYEMQKEHDRRRSPDVFSDAIGDIASAAGSLVNGTKGTLAKIEDTFGRGPRDAPDGEHQRPIAQEGTCMCINRIYRARSTRRFEPAVRARAPPGAADRRPKPLRLGRRTTLAGGLRYHSAPDDAVTQQHVLDESPPRGAENATRGSSAATVRVVRVADLIGEDVRTIPSTSGMRASPSDSTCVSKLRDLDDDVILELQQATQIGSEDGTSRRNTIDTGGPPPWLESIKSAEKSQSTTRAKQKATSPNEVGPKKTNDTDKIDDDGYYFLFYSGGTANRTTAKKNIKREPTIEEHSNPDNDLDVTKELPIFLRRLHSANGKGSRTLQSSIDLTTGGDDISSAEKIITFSPVNVSAESVNGVRRIQTQDSGERANVKTHDRVQREERQRKNPREGGTAGSENKTADASNKTNGGSPPKNGERLPGEDGGKSQDGKNDTQPKVQNKTEADLLKHRIQRQNKTEETTTVGPSANETANETEEETEEEGGEGGEKLEKGSNTYLYSVTIPTAACLLLLILALCVLAKPSGNCCDRFLRNPGQPSRSERAARARQALVKEQAKTQQSQPELRSDEAERAPRRVKLQEGSGATSLGRQRKLREAVVAFARIDRKRDGGSAELDADGQREVVVNRILKERKGTERKLRVERKERERREKEERRKIVIDRERIWEEEQRAVAAADRERRSVPSGDTSFDITSLPT